MNSNLTDEQRREHIDALETEAGPRPTEPAGDGKAWMVVRHACTNVSTWRVVTLYLTKEYHCYRCQCGDTVFVGAK